MKTMLALGGLFLVGCVGTANQFQSSTSWFKSPAETLKYGDPSGRVDPGQVAMRHGAQLDETAGVISAATIPNPQARKEATDALVKISQDRNQYGWGWGGYGSIGGGGAFNRGAFGGFRQNDLQKGAIVNETGWPVRVEFAPTASYSNIGPQPTGAPRSIIVRAMSFEFVTLPPGEYRFTAYNQKGQIVSEDRNKQIDWIHNNSPFWPPGIPHRLNTDWLYAIQ